MNKYCVYQKSDGSIEVWEYIDNAEEAMHYFYVADRIRRDGVKNVMPICMNKMGAYHTFDKSECIAIIESNTWPSISSHFELFKGIINNKNFEYGWIDALGNTYSCGYMQHAKVADDLVKIYYSEEYSKSTQYKDGINAPDDFLLDKGWIKIVKGSPCQIYRVKSVTNEALEKLLLLRNLKQRQ